MLYRQALQAELEAIFKAGFAQWHKNRTYEQYCIDNAKEDAYGTRYVIEVGDEIVSSLIVLEFSDIGGSKVYGIGSVITPKLHTGQGFATELLKNSIQQKDDAYIFLYSEIAPVFYERFGFRILPPAYQKDAESICMVKCSEDNWNKLLKYTTDAIPNHF
jgi:hypothetical protein